MTKKLNEKYNDSCIKLFEFLKMMYDDEAEFKDVINLLANGKYDGKSNTHVTLNKYLNALKIFGLKVKKIKNKYKLQNALYKMQFSLEDIKTILRIESAKNLFPKGKNKQNIDNFIKQIEMRFDESSQNIKQAIENNNFSSEFYNSELIEQIKKCEEYCQQQQKLEIIYSDSDNTEINLLCSPKEIIYMKRKIYLRVIGNNGSRIYDIPIDNIKNVKSLPTASSSQAIPTTVVYRIKNRLTKNYKIRDWEYVDRVEQDGSQIIINKNEDLNLLIKRIMRYGTEAEIISPKFVKEEMIELINKTLSNYQ